MVSVIMPDGALRSDTLPGDVHQVLAALLTMLAHPTILPRSWTTSRVCIVRYALGCPFPTRRAGTPRSCQSDRADDPGAALLT